MCVALLLLLTRAHPHKQTKLNHYSSQRGIPKNNKENKVLLSWFFFFAKYKFFIKQTTQYYKEKSLNQASITGLGDCQQNK